LEGSELFWLPEAAVWACRTDREWHTSPFSEFPPNFAEFEDLMSEVLHVALREQTGTAATRRLRKAGQTPVVLYGHGQESVHLAVSSTEVATLVRHHGKTVQLKGDASDHALVSDMQWDPLGVEVLHMDLIRVDLSEKVVVTVPVHLHGDPVGVHQGGMLLENVHEVEIRCGADQIPDELRLAVSGLALGESLTAEHLELPAGVELVTPAETVLCHVEAPKRDDEDEAATGGGDEPEVIGKKETEEEED
jgi:large subunit ribosomal protein L25